METKVANQLNPLVLAFLGDAEFTLFVRKRLVAMHDMKSGGLHKLTSKYVSARAQAKIYEEIGEFLTENESEIARRCRNSHNVSKAKNAGLADYKKATALEGVIGFLSLTDYPRCEQVMQKSVEIIEREEQL